jgi:5-methylcytosine-specific restriction enzyme A
MPKMEISTEQFKNALATNGVLLEGDLELLRAHFYSPRQSATATELKELLGYTGVIQVNGAFGGLGHRIADHLNLAVPTRDADTNRWWSVLAHGVQAKRGFVWKLRDELVSALSELFADASRARPITGKFLNELWGIGAEHALYSFDGTWYHRLTRFPGALCDSEGYVLFATKAAFDHCSFLRIRQDVGCPGGIHQIPGYVRCGSQAATDLNLPSKPGRVEQRVSRIIRDTALSSELKLLYGHSCQLCGTVIKVCGGGYSEAHHIKPLGSPHDGDDTRDNLLCVCPNCHVLLDYAAIPLKPDGLKILRHHLNPANVAYHNSLHLEARAKTSVSRISAGISQCGSNLVGDVS